MYHCLMYISRVIYICLTDRLLFLNDGGLTNLTKNFKPRQNKNIDDDW